MKITFKRPKFLLPLDTKEQKKNEDKSNLFLVAIILGVLAFIPLCGVVFGIIAIILSFTKYSSTKQKKYFIPLGFGLGGILFTIIAYGSLFYFGFIQRGGIYDGLRAEMAQTQMSSTINTIEAYKSRYGKYPDKIEDLSKISSDPFLIIDQVQMAQMFSNMGKDLNQNYYYEKRSEESYYLFSKGIDGEAFTKDDIYPQFKDDKGNIGYIKPIVKISK